MPKFQTGNKMTPAKGTKPRLMADCFRYLLLQPSGESLLLGHPKKQTVLQAVCRAIINKALAGEEWAAKELLLRVDGRYAEANEGAEYNPENDGKMPLKEAARIVGYLLLSQSNAAAGSQEKPH